MSQSGGQRGGLLSKLGLKKKKLDSTDRSAVSVSMKETDQNTPRARRRAEGSVAASSFYADSGSSHSLSGYFGQQNSSSQSRPSRPGDHSQRAGVSRRVPIGENRSRADSVRSASARSTSSRSSMGSGRHASPMGTISQPTVRVGSVVPSSRQPSRSRGARVDTPVNPPTDPSAPTVPLTPRTAKRKTDLTNEILFIQGSISRWEDELRHRRAQKILTTPKNRAEKNAREERRKLREIGVWVGHVEPLHQHSIPILQCMTSREVIRWLEARVRLLMEHLRQSMERYQVQFGDWVDSYDPCPIEYLGSAATAIEPHFNQLVISQASARAEGKVAGSVANRPLATDVGPYPGTLRPGQHSQPRPSTLNPSQPGASQPSSSQNLANQPPRKAPRQEAPIPVTAFQGQVTPLDTSPDTPRPGKMAEQDIGSSGGLQPNSSRSDGAPWPPKANLPETGQAGGLYSQDLESLRETHVLRFKAQGMSDSDIERIWEKTVERRGERQEWLVRDGRRAARKTMQDSSRREPYRPSMESQSQSREELRLVAQAAERQRQLEEPEERRGARLEAEVIRQRAIREGTMPPTAPASQSSERDRTSRHPKPPRESSRSQSRERHSSAVKGASGSQSTALKPVGAEWEVRKNADGTPAYYPKPDKMPRCVPSSTSAVDSEVPKGGHGSDGEPWGVSSVASQASGAYFVEEFTAQELAKDSLYPESVCGSRLAPETPKKSRHVAHGGSPRQQWLLNDVKAAFDMTNEDFGIASEDTEEGLYHTHGTVVIKPPRGVAASRGQESTVGDSIISRRNSKSRLSQRSDPSSPSERDDTSTMSQFGRGLSTSASRRESPHGEERDQVGELPARTKSQARLTKAALNAETTASSTNSSMVTYTGHPGSAPAAAANEAVRAH